jgi:hypothetical protein
MKELAAKLLCLVEATEPNLREVSDLESAKPVLPGGCELRPPKARARIRAWRRRRCKITNRMGPDVRSLERREFQGIIDNVGIHPMTKQI